MKISTLFQIAVLFTALIGTTFTATSHQFEVDGIYYNISGTNAIVTYRGGHFNSYDDEYFGNVSIPTTVTYNGTTYSVTSIGYSAFNGCSGLTSITIPNSVTSIEGFAFQKCSGLTSATIGYSVTSIGEYAFSLCSGLTSVNIPNSVTYIGGYAFWGCSGLPSITIPNFVTIISDGVFDGCSGLKSITIPNSVAYIGGYAFLGCSGLSSIIIPNSVTYIGGYAFDGCSSMKRAIIGNSVNTVGSGVFRGCTNLTQVICKANMPPKYETNHDDNPLFEDITYQNAILYVPDITYGYYRQADPWKNFMEIKTESYSDEGVSFMSNIYPTSIKMEAINGTGTQQSNSYFTFEGSKYNTLLVTGLEPTSIYSGTYTSKAPDGTTETSFKFFTSELTMVPEGAKMLTETTALLKAETNMADEETICGFDWRLYEGPDDYLGTRVYCPVYDGTMAGTLKGLKKDTFYKYRPFYKSNANNVYYGDWVTFYTGDVGVEFAPVVYTYDSPAVTQNSATLQGVALRGSDEITEQGFEYWKRNGSVTKVTAEGERMSKTVTGLTAGTTYTFRAYLKSGGKTTYGREVDFVTVSGGMDVNADGAVNIADVNQIINYILSGKYVNLGDVNGDGTINITDVNLIINEILSH